MPIIADPLFWALAIPAFLLTGISKGGFASGAGNVAVPLMSLVIPAPQAAGIALPVLCAMDLTGLRAWWGRWSARDLRAILPGGLLGVALGAAMFGLLSDRHVKLMVGTIALVFLARSLWQARPGRVAPPPATPHRGKAGFWAMLSGLTSTIAHAGGPPLAVYLYPLRLDRAQLAATVAVFFAVLNYVKLVPYFVLGQLSATNLLTALLLLPLAPIGVRIGIWLAGRMSDRAFYRLIYAMLFVTGVKLVWDGLGF
ncbi:sulfite exporter TauE/SafE family protein [Falsiroseomonas oryzae]|uniref:sulfite exporter TauE/SafE family protein n=1 Tax=Falsiroseomonas oryzae TaxID=2766473 RepID=UPI0022EB0AD1|nr:sulfite exporter TauE/SafE family protein [Roseomonas sp. MO-31]